MIGKNRRDSGYGVLLLVGSCFDDLLENHKDEEVKHKSDKKYVPEFETDNHRTFKLIAAIATVDGSITPTGEDETHGTVMAWTPGGVSYVIRIIKVACTVTQARVHV